MGLTARHGRLKTRRMLNVPWWCGGGWVAAILAVLLSGCASHVAQPGKGGDDTSRLHRLLEDYYQARLVLFPLEASAIGDHRYDDRLTNDISDAHRAQVAALAERCARELERIDRARLSEADQLSWDVFRSDLTRIRDGLKFPEHWLPVGKMQDLPTAFVLLGSGKDVQPFQTVRDYERFLGRVDGFRAWVETAMANMRQGMAAGVVQPRIIIEKSLAQWEALLAMDEHQNPFYQPVHEMPAGFSARDKERLTRVYREAIQQRIMPAYRRLVTFTRTEYLPSCRETLGWSALPQGREWYAQLVRYFTTTDLTPDQLYETGLAEVARLQQEMERLKASADFNSDLAAFAKHLDQTSPGVYKSKDALVQAYRDLRATVEPRLPALFGHLPRNTYEIRPVEAFREATSSSQLTPAAPDGSRPAVFYVNAAGIEQTPQFVSESLFLHEAMPGHHLQSAIAMERTDLPSFRRFGWYDAYGEGWALYSEGLGSELGCYRDARQRLDSLGSEMFRARRLVVDVGLHLKGWSRDRAYRYLMETPGFTAADAALEVDRYIAWPGQALSYKTGQLRICALRAKAEQALGPHFDVRAFHDELVKDGGLPLDVLEAKLDRWIAAQGK